MASIAASTAQDAAAIGEDTRVPGADAEHGDFIPKDSHISEQDEVFQQDASHMSNQESISPGKPEIEYTPLQVLQCRPC